MRVRLPAWYTLVLTTNALVHATVYAVRPLATYRALELHAGPAEVGAVASTFALFSFFMAVPAGRWVDRWGEPPFILAGSVLTTLGALLAGWAGSVAMLAATQAFLGLGHLLAVVASQALIANRTDESIRDDRVGLYTVMASLGQLAGPALVSLVAGSGGERNLQPAFWLGAALTAVAGGLAWPLAKSAGAGAARGHVRAAGAGAGHGGAAGAGHGGAAGTGRGVVAGAGRAAARVAAGFGQVARILRRPGMIPAMLASLTVLSSIDILSAYLPVLGEIRGLPVSVVGLLLSVRAALSMVSRLFMAALLRRFERGPLLFACMALPALAVAALPWMPSVAGLCALMAVAGLGLGLGQPLTMTWVANRAPRDQRGTALGVRLSGNRLGQLVMPAMVGSIAGALGEAAIFWVVAGWLLLAALWVVRAPFGEHDPVPAAPGDASSTASGGSAAAARGPVSRGMGGPAGR